MERETEGGNPPRHWAIFRRILLEHQALRPKKRELLLRLLARSGTVLTADDLARLDDCPDGILDDWIDDTKGKALREGKRDMLLRFVARAEIALRDEDRARIQACDDDATLDRWIENALAAQTAVDVFSMR